MLQNINWLIIGASSLSLLNYILLSIIVINLYRSIDSFGPNRNESQRSLDRSKALLTEQEDTELQFCHTHNNSVARFDEFYNHYMSHLLSEMSREEQLIFPRSSSPISLVD